jgi:hypothetical protein
MKIESTVQHFVKNINLFPIRSRMKSILLC